MYKLKHFLIWCLLIGTLASCGKENDPEPQAQQDYLPTTKGSSWSYGGTHPYTVTVTGETKLINGKTYVEFESKQGTTATKSYYLKENGNYTGVGVLPEYGTAEITILKEGAAIGETWEHSFDMQSFTNIMTLSITDKNISKTVEGKTYNNVIRVKLITSVKMMDIEIPVATSYYYFAKGVGLILSEVGTQLNTPLVSYTIK